ncbi:MAG: putative membrane protein [Cellvibrionaceae bacterium]|jgi:uncharacterized membrane protein
MAIQTPSHSKFSFQFKRWQLALAIIAVLSLMGFWTISDPSRLSASGILTAGDYAGAAFCHRIAIRSFTIAGRPVGLCARCSGMYLGFFIYLALVLLSGRERWTAFAPIPVLLLMLGFVGIMGIDGINSYSHFFPNAPHLYTPNNTLRLFTGLGTGIAIGSFIVPAVAQTLWKDQVYRPAVGTLPELLGLIFVTVLGGLLLLAELPITTYVLAILSILGLLFILSGINTILMLILTKRENSINHWTQAILPLALGFCLACAEAAGLVTLRLMFIGTIHGIPGLG